ncbi:MAG: hypothetical protein JOZ39_12755, partial [Chloroflexi bacterium]|nr:hypothetical protein [Chloroflexota bacterium]
WVAWTIGHFALSGAFLAGVTNLIPGSVQSWQDSVPVPWAFLESVPLFAAVGALQVLVLGDRVPGAKQWILRNAILGAIAVELSTQGLVWAPAPLGSLVGMCFAMPTVTGLLMVGGDWYQLRNRVAHPMRWFAASAALCVVCGVVNVPCLTVFIAAPLEIGGLGLIFLLVLPKGSPVLPANSDRSILTP